MIIKVTDIPQGGRELEFVLAAARLSGRASLHSKRANLGPSYEFQKAAQVRIKINLEGSTVLAQGSVAGYYLTSCSRCAEDVQAEFNIPVQISLKIKNSNDPNHDIEDVNFGFYDGREVDCASFCEEFVLLSLPYSVLCDDDCKGLCPLCGINKNSDKCSCSAKQPADSPWTALKDIKIM